MKANTLNKISISIEQIYKDIQEMNECGQYKIFIPHYMHVSDDTRLKLIEDGFKVYKGNWDGMITGCLIIEW